MNNREAVWHCMPMAKKDPWVEPAVHPLWGYLVACLEEGQQGPYQAGRGAHSRQLWLHLKKKEKIISEGILLKVYIIQELLITFCKRKFEFLCQKHLTLITYVFIIISGLKSDLVHFLSERTPAENLIPVWINFVSTLWP